VQTTTAIDATNPPRNSTFSPAPCSAVQCNAVCAQSHPDQTRPDQTRPIISGRYIYNGDR
jgi:hypothetical protein